MKLVRYGAPGAEKPGLVDAQGGVRDLSAHVPDISGATLSPSSLAKLRAIDPLSLPLVAAGTRLGPPVARVWNFIAIGLNFVDHAKETGAQIPPEPILFNKAGNCIVGPDDNVMVPKDSKQLDYEVEIAFVIGTRARYVAEADAMAHIAGYTICNDVSERHWQKDRKGQWVKGKAFETSGPLGPWLVTTDEIADPHALAMRTVVDGDVRQNGTTADMIFKIPFLLAYVSQFMVLEPGDVITTGTPAGVALGMKEPKWLQAGQTMTLSIDKLGQQRQHIVPFKM
ncbi:MAG: fumarylacetoacetate hydrolase family protein [Hyphomicrobiaceae bacterium]|nr:fumarylacetoacetate hydrolase family protein [Hyphomicrobiaceae bacterium]